MGKSVRGGVLSALLSVMLVFSFIPIAPTSAHAADVAEYSNAAAEVKTLESHGGVVTASELKSSFGLTWKDTFRVVCGEFEVEGSFNSSYEREWLLQQGAQYSLEVYKFKGGWTSQGTFTVKVYDELTVKTNRSGAVTLDGISVDAGETGKTVKVYRSETARIVVGEVPGHNVSITLNGEDVGSSEVGSLALAQDATVVVTYTEQTNNSFVLGSNNGAATVTVAGKSLTAGNPVSVSKDARVEVEATANTAGGYYIKGVTAKKDGSSSDFDAAVTGLSASANIQTGEKESYEISVESAQAMTLVNDLSINYNDSNKDDVAALKGQILKLVKFADVVGFSTADNNKRVEYLAYKSQIGLVDDIWLDLGEEREIDLGLTSFKRAFGDNATETVRVSWDVNNDGTYEYAKEFEVSLSDQRVTTEVKLSEVDSSNSITVGYDEWSTWKNDEWESKILAALGASLVDGEGVPVQGRSLKLAFAGEISYPLEPGSYGVTVSFAGDATHKASSATATLIIDKVPTDCSITLGSNDAKATVKVNVGGEAKVLGSDGVSIEEKANFSISAKPADGYYVKSITVSQNGAAVSSGTLSYDKTVTTTGTITAGTNLTYVVNVECAQAEIVLNDDDPSINWNSYMDAADAEAALFALIDAEKSIPGLTADGVTIEYGANGLGGYAASWQPLDYQPLLGVLYHAFGDGTESEYIKISFAGNDKYPATSTTFKVKLSDSRVETLVNLNVGQSVVYSEDITEQQMFDLVFDSLITVDGSPLTEADGKAFEPKLGENMSISYDEIHAGTVGVTVKFLGDKNYKPSETTVDVTVMKAPSSVTVNSQVVSYQDVSSIDALISVDPASVSYISFAMGLDLQERGSYLQLNLPELVDLSAIEGTALEGLIKPILDEVYASLKPEVSLSELAGILSSALEALNGIGSYLPINVDTQVIETLVSLLESIEGLDGVGDLTVKVTVGSTVVPENSGVYLVGAVTADSDYETSANVGYLVIKPNATQVDLAFNMEDSNGFITAHAIVDGSFDLGSHVVQGDLTDEQLAVVTAKLHNIYFGVLADGTAVTSNEPLSDFGAYTQIAYIEDLGNVMYWAMPITRAYAVVADLAVVEFVDENGQVNNDRVFTYDGQPKAMTAVAKDRVGNELDSANITYRYLGIEGDAEGYCSTSAPKAAGAYTVIATYADSDNLYMGAAVGAMVIKPAEATVSVISKTHTYDGSAVDVAAMVQVDPADAKVAIVTVGLAVDGDFSENGLNDIAGTVNIDFPVRVDAVLKGIVPAAYEEGITLAMLTDKLSQLRAALGESGCCAEALDRLIALLADAPDNVTLTFKEQADVNPNAIGMYYVAAVVMDPDYQAAAASGTLIIAPKLTEATLEWNSPVTTVKRPDLSSVDFGAKAMVDSVEDKGLANRVEDSDLTDRIEYLFVGLDSGGNKVAVSDAASLPNGVYTQIAYICDGVSASMVLAAPISRVVTVVADVATVKVVSDEVSYDGGAHGCAVSVSDSQGNPITGERLAGLAVKYVGVTAAGEPYNSGEAPVDAGAYSVIAEYKEFDANGNLVRIGADVGTLRIHCAAAQFNVKDTTLTYGEGGFIEIENPNSLDYIAVVVDQRNNVNVILPDAWGVAAKSFDVKGGVEQLLAQLEALGQVVDGEWIAQLKALLEGVPINTLTINGNVPTEVGTYDVTGIAFGKNYRTAVDSGVLTIKGKEVDPVGPVDPVDPTDPVDPADPDGNGGEGGSSEGEPSELPGASGGTAAGGQGSEEAKATALANTADSSMRTFGAVGALATLAVVVLFLARRRSSER